MAEFYFLECIPNTGFNLQKPESLELAQATVEKVRRAVERDLAVLALATAEHQSDMWPEPQEPEVANG